MLSYLPGLGARTGRDLDQGTSGVGCPQHAVQEDDGLQPVCGGTRRGPLSYLADPGGHAPLGFLRLPPTHVLAIDTDTIGVAVRMFEQYASGTRSIEEVAGEFGLNDRRVNDMLKNPVYNGWVGRKGELVPAPWRSNPPVSDELRKRVAELRSQRARHAGRQHPAWPDLLRGLLYCVCGQRVRTDGTMGTPPRQRKMHPRHEDCADWGPKASYSAEA